jgi:DNA-binding GntR family transcriptional regulator
MQIRAIDLAQLASPADVIFDALREAITLGTLVEGAVLRQESIAKMFNVSRIPVREAFTRLEEQGLIVTQRYRGAVVASLSFEEIEEIFEFRALIEPEVIRHSVEKISSESLEIAAEYSARFSASTDPKQWGDLNRQFHYSLYRDCGRPYYLQIAEASLNRIERYQRAQLTLTAGMDRARSEHDGILQACMRRDADAAAERTREHIRGAERSLISFLKRARGTEQAAQM